MASDSNDSDNSVVSSTGDWDQPGNVVDTLGWQPKVTQSKLEKELKSKYSFDKHREFSDVRIYDIQNSDRFRQLFYALKFPRCPLYSSIMCCFLNESYRFKPERLLQRKICLDFCNWDPSNCFLEDSHSGKFEDLMSEEFHSMYNPEFESQFGQDYVYPQLVYPGRFSPPNVDELVDKIGISSKLEYEDGIAVKMENLSNQNRKKGSPLFTFEEKKVHDIIEALIEVSKERNEEYKNHIKGVYTKSFNSSGEITKPILSLMMWGPQTNDFFPDAFQVCDLVFDPDNVDIHRCNNFLAKDFWMFRHEKNIPCNEAGSTHLDGPAMTEQLTTVYPCNHGRCIVDCLCKFCEKTRTNLCDINDHKYHLESFEPECPVQKESQCQNHWVGHPKNFDVVEDIVVEKNMFFHNNQLVEQPRSYKVEEIRFSNIKKSCLLCRGDVYDHFKNHMVLHVQCKLCHFQMSSYEDKSFWEKVCNICNKILPSTSLIYWHKRGHAETGNFECDVCQLVLKKKSYLKRHLEEIHNQDQDTKGYEEEDETSDSDVSVSESSENSSGFDTDESVSFPTTSKQNYKCDTCDIDFLLRRYLDDHLRYNHGICDFECDICGKNFKHSKDLKRHNRSKHRIALDLDKYQPLGPKLEKILTCEVCSKVFQRKDLLKKHKHTHKALKKIHTCKHCNKSFTRKDNMQDHIRSVHNNERPYKCNLCSRTFKKKYHLKRHVSVKHN